jgi:hypothetical protein
MAHPEKNLENKKIKRTHYKATVAQIATCRLQVKHLYRAYWHEENVLQRAVVIDKSVAVA